MHSFIKRKTTWERFHEKIVKAEGHWLWIGAHKPTGYGMFYFREDDCFIAHRASYIMHKGEIPDHLVIDHECKVKSCVNPDHLRLVTQLDNCTILAARLSPHMRNRLKTHCIRGHSFDTTLKCRGRPHRACTVCLKARQEKYKKAKAA